MNETEDFKNRTYRSQVRILREFAKAGIRKYDLKIRSLDFINHGENATFRVKSTDGEFLLRIHRKDYHSKEAILEELSWLKHLANSSPELKSLIPQPLKSSKGQFLEFDKTNQLPGGRHFALLKWTYGRFIWKSVTPRHMFQLGKLIAKLHQNRPKSATLNRRYWDSEGLVGKVPKFGSLQKLNGVNSSDQRLINTCRTQLYRRLKKYEMKHPDRMGMIHADLHFGNLINTQNGLAAIDFDDCGFGFNVYDLAIPIQSLYNNKKSRKISKIDELKKALIAGYSETFGWDEDDERILEDLMMARKIVMLGWLNSRRDNPRLKKYMPIAVKNAIAAIKKYNNRRLK